MPREEIKAGDQTAAAINLEQTSFGYQVYLMLEDLTSLAVTGLNWFAELWGYDLVNITYLKLFIK